MYCYISRNYRGLSSAGNKAKSDIEKIAEKDVHCKNIGLPFSTSNNTVVHFLRNLAGVIKAPFSMHRGDILILQYPLKKYYTFVCNMAHLCGAKTVTLIHDLGSFRRKALTVDQEIERLNHTDVVIAHNEKMKKWLEDHGCKSILMQLGIFDYLSSAPLPEEKKATAARNKKYTVVYAGALTQRKNAFLYEWGTCIRSYDVALYGSNFDIDAVKGKEHFCYHGFMQSDNFIKGVQGDFGLVWDGPSVTSCEGNFGEYLKLNNPHKTSFYLRSGLPVIIWKEAALADFVASHGVGICINSLDELDGILKRMTADEYLRLRNNVMRESRRLQAGYYASFAIKNAIETLDA